MGNAECVSNKYWDPNFIQQTFRDVGINYISSKKFLSEDEAKCKIGNVLSSEKEPIYNIGVFINNDLSFFVNGDFPGAIINFITEEKIGERVCSKSDTETQKISGFRIFDKENLKSLVTTIKNYYEETKPDTTNHNNRSNLYVLFPRESEVI